MQRTDQQQQVFLGVLVHLWSGFDWAAVLCADSTRHHPTYQRWSCPVWTAARTLRTERSPWFLVLGPPALSGGHIYVLHTQRSEGQLMSNSRLPATPPHAYRTPGCSRRWSGPAAESSLLRSFLQGRCRARRWSLPRTTRVTGEWAGFSIWLKSFGLHGAFTDFLCRCFTARLNV